ncbi:hypothetical protein WJX72_010101 [[Myrmecia] bisecta]|uniref:SET domain-containing protein n=1 Tax=[Myrmecia] bisecta TaxID=41462 RepID=A0AAW1Q8J2_9CHLO
MEQTAEALAAKVVALGPRPKQAVALPPSPIELASKNCVRPLLPAFCLAFDKCGVTRVAVVGNGPITDAQRREINSMYQVVVRFNYQNNRLPGEPVDVWVMRFADAATMHFWGISQMERDEGLEALAATSSVWLLGRLQDTWNATYFMTQPLLRRYPELAARHYTVLDYKQAGKVTELHAWDSSAELSASSGWLGLQYVCDCARPLNASIHMYGFNWHWVHANAHSIKAEQRSIQVAAQRGDLVIHPAACEYGLRSCEGTQDTHRDCKAVSGTANNTSAASPGAPARTAYRCPGEMLGLAKAASVEKAAPTQTASEDTKQHQDSAEHAGLHDPHHPGNQLLAWMREGGCYVHDGVFIGQPEGFPYSGMFTTQELKAGDLIFSLPLNMTVPLGGGSNAELAVYLLEMVHDPDHAFRVFWDIWPRPGGIMSAAEMSGQHLQLIQDPVLISAVQRKNNWTAAFAAAGVDTSAPGFSPETASVRLRAANVIVGLADIQWATALLTSREFTFTSDTSGEQQQYLVPGMDMVNHCDDGMAGWDMLNSNDPSTWRFQFWAQVDIEAWSEICWQYHDMRNDDSALAYGFLTDDRFPPPLYSVDAAGWTPDWLGVGGKLSVWYYGMWDWTCPTAQWPLSHPVDDGAQMLVRMRLLRKLAIADELRDLEGALSDRLNHQFGIELFTKEPVCRSMIKPYRGYLALP